MRITELDFLEKKARTIRATCVQLAHDGGVGHLGSALSCVEALVVLYYHWLRITPQTCSLRERDRFIMSKGHGCSSFYSVLADRSFIPKEWLNQYAVPNSTLPSHPCKYALGILECSTGSLGHGLGIATGMLYGLRLDGSNARVAVLMSDGECNEGSVWEAAMFAAANKLDNLVALVDYNGIQAVGRSDKIMGYTSLEDKFKAFGWGASTVDGNSIQHVMAILDSCPIKHRKPSAIILRTKKGAGVSFMVDEVLWHYRVPSDEDLKRALAELGAKPIHL